MRDRHYNDVMVTQCYADYPQALDALARTIRARTFSPDEYYVVLTPDRYTLHAENALFKGGGALDCEVLTLSRLARRVLGNRKVLSREGSVMIIACAIAAVKDRLGFYGRAARYNDFAREVYDTLIQIESSGVKIEDIKATGATAEKLADLALIKNEYDRRKAECQDAPDRLKELISCAGSSEFIASAHFFAIGYANATKLNAEVFEAIAKHARSFTLFDAMPPSAVRESLRVYRAPDPVTQYKAVASRIREYVHKGGKYGDVSIICTEPRTLSRILREYRIDFYADSSDPLSDTPPLNAIACAYRLKSGSDTLSLVSLCKNPFSGVRADDAEKLQNYLAERGIEYGATARDIDDEDACRALRRAKELIDCFDGSFADACDSFMERADFDAVAKRLYSDETDMIAPIRALVELVRRYGSGEFDADAAGFFSSARAVNVKSLPRLKDRVTVCGPQGLRMTKCKMLFVVDFNEGLLPACTQDSGLIGDAEIVATGGVIEPTVREQNRRERNELFAVIQNADDVFCSYSTACGGRRAAFLRDCALSVDEFDYAEECAVLKHSRDGGFIARFASVPSAARELAARGMTEQAASITAAVGKSGVDAVPFAPSIDGVTRKSLSVSELTHWFYCPYKRFLADSIGLKERRRVRLGAPDFGLIMHEFMRRFILQKPLDASREAVEKTVLAVLSESGVTATDAERERIIRDACDYAAANKAVLETGDYVPALTEKQFGGKIFLGETGTPFVGVIDRVDVCGDRARIMDYKTGNKKFDIKMCINGCDMQLPLYAAAIDDKRVTGMFYVPLRALYGRDCERLSGCMIKDEGIALEYDRRLELGEKSTVINAQFKIKDGQQRFARDNSQLMDEDEFDALIDTALATAGRAADEIGGGYIDRTPCAGACGFCAFGGICAGDKRPRGGDCDENAVWSGE